jgi:hypothetical protein
MSPDMTGSAFAAVLYARGFALQGGYIVDTSGSCEGFRCRPVYEADDIARARSIRKAVAARKAEIKRRKLAALV